MVWYVWLRKQTMPVITVSVTRCCWGASVVLIPVSYTHLDVYKRQTVISAEVYQIWKKEMLLLDDEGNELLLPLSLIHICKIMKTEGVYVQFSEEAAESTITLAEQAHIATAKVEDQKLVVDRCV